MPDIRRPCKTCPWRKDAPLGHWHHDHFESIYTGCQDDGLAVMLCHGAAKMPEAERAGRPCQGWLRALGFDAIGVRLAVMRGNATCDEVNDLGGPELYESFDDMMEANGVEPPERNRFIREE